MIYDNNSNGATIAQRMLNHASVKTTKRAYAAVRTRSTKAAYIQILLLLMKSKRAPKRKKDK
jgi:integrase